MHFFSAVASRLSCRPLGRGASPGPPRTTHVGPTHTLLCSAVRRKAILSVCITHTCFPFRTMMIKFIAYKVKSLRLGDGKSFFRKEKNRSLVDTS